MGVAQLFVIFGLVFFVALVYVGFLTRKWIHDTSDFILAGREVSTALNIFGVAAIGFAGTAISVVPGFAVLYGFWSSYLNQLIFCIGGLSLYGVFFTTFIRRCGAQTLPEWLEMRYNSNVRFIVTIGTIIGLTGIMANNVVSIAVVLTSFIELPLIVTVSAIFFVFLLFSYAGGLWAVTFTDFVQLVLGLVAVPLIIYALFTSFGDFTWLLTRWPEAWTSGVDGTIPIFSLRFPSILTSLFLFAAFLVWGNNYYWLRSASCRSEKAARNSFIWAGIFIAVVFYIPLVLVGVYARAAFPELLGAADYFEATTAYGLILRQVPIFIASILLLVPLAAGISTATTAHMGATSVAVRDIYQRRIKPEATQKQLLVPSRIILLLLGILVWLLCFYPGGPMVLFAFANAWLGPPAILVLLGVLWRRFTATAAFWSAITSITVMFILTITDLVGFFSIDKYMHVGIAGFIIGTSLALVLTYFTKPHYYGEKTWSKTPVKGNRKEVDLKEDDLVVLEFIFQGYNNMSELSDLTGKDTADLNQVIEKLDLGGLIEREALFGSGFYTFSVSEMGLDMLPEMSDEKRQLAEDNLTEESLGVLRVIKGDPGMLVNLVKKEELTSLKLSTLLAKLIRENYLIEGGFWKRKIKISEMGETTLKKYEDVKIGELNTNA